MNYIALAAGTILIILFSWWLSIRFKRYHGISRFFAFESVFILILLNYKVWFTDPFSWHQLISWVLLFFSFYPVISGYILLKRHGRATINFENTSRLVKTGIYHFIRHPLYLSVFLFGTGVMMKDPGTIQVILGIINLVAVYMTSRIEEGEMIAKFGDEYREYIKETRMFVPYIF
jgi:protein-S-isoprenylcysteine O-methyltransferase Ste14